MAIDRETKYPWQYDEFAHEFYIFTVQAMVVDRNGKPDKVANTFTLTHDQVVAAGSREREIRAKVDELKAWMVEREYTISDRMKPFAVWFHFPLEKGGGSVHLWDEAK